LRRRARVERLGWVGARGRMLVLVVALASSPSMASAEPPDSARTPRVAFERIVSCLQHAGALSVQRSAATPWLGSARFRRGFGEITWQLIVRRSKIVETEAAASWEASQAPQLTVAVKACLKPYKPVPIPGQTAIFVG
jgi:hypothetical protein